MQVVKDPFYESAPQSSGLANGIDGVAIAPSLEINPVCANLARFGPLSQ